MDGRKGDVRMTKKKIVAANLARDEGGLGGADGGADGEVNGLEIR